MYIPLGDRLLVTKHTITEDFKTRSGVLLPSGFQHDTDPPDLLRIEGIGTGPNCKFLEVGDMVLLQPGSRSFKVYTSKGEQLEYFIINAFSIIGRAKMQRDERGVEA